MADNTLDSRLSSNNDTTDIPLSVTIESVTIPTSRTIVTACLFDPTLGVSPHSIIRIDDITWVSRLQDEGCQYDSLIKRTYCSNKIPPYGTEEETIYYYELSCIPIDFIKNINIEKAAGSGWNRFPKKLY